MNGIYGNHELHAGQVCKIDSKRYRILAIRTETSDWTNEKRENIVLIEMDINKFRFLIQGYHEIMSKIISGEYTLEDDSSDWPMYQQKPGDKKLLDLRYDCIRKYMKRVHPYYEVFQSRGFPKEEQDELMEQTGLSRPSLLKYIRRYLQSGFRYEGLLDRRNKNGSESEHALVRGKKSRYGESKVILNENVIAQFEEAFQAYIRACNQKEYQSDTKHKPKLETFYWQMIVKYYSIVVDGKAKILPKTEYPSIYRFRYWVSKKIGGQRLKEYGTSSINKFNNQRILTGDVHHGISRAGECVELDEHEFDMVLVSAIDMNQNQIIGSPVIYVAIDVMSHAIVGASIQIQTNNSYAGVLNLFDSMLIGDKANADLFNSTHKGRVFPGVVIPEEVKCDHGSEYTSKAFRENLTGGNTYFKMEGIPITIKLVSPGAGSMKPLVERFFGKVEERILEVTFGGYGTKSHAAKSKHDKQATLNIFDLRRLVYMIIAEHNNTVIEGYPVTPEIVNEVEVLTPLNLYDYSIKTYGQYLPTGKEMVSRVRYGLMKNDKNFILSRKQISYGDFLYYDILDDNELLTDAIALGDRSKRLDLRYDPRNISFLYRRDENGKIITYSLAKARDNLRHYKNYSWAEFDRFLAEFRQSERLQLDMKKEQQAINTMHMREIVIDADKDHKGIKNKRNIKENVKAAGKLEKQLLNYDEMAYKNAVFHDNPFENDGIETDVIDVVSVELPTEEDVEVSTDDVDFSKFDDIYG